MAGLYQRAVVTPEKKCGQLPDDRIHGLATHPNIPIPTTQPCRENFNLN